MKIRPSICATLVAAPVCIAALPTNNSKAQGLNDLAKKAGLLYFGTAVDNPSLNNSEYLSIAYNKHEFGQITPANGQKWLYTEPTQNTFNYTLGDAITAPALSHHQLLRCHNLNWYSQLPTWLTAGNWTQASLLAVLETHIAHEVSHYRGHCYAWDVVNEALADDGTWRQDLWYNITGTAYVSTAFRAARKHDPGAKLYYNDYGIETPGNKSSAAQALVRDLRAQGIEIDGVGLQSHFVAAEAPSYELHVQNMRAFAELGVEVAITELDVRIALPDDPNKAKQQAVGYADAVRACKDVDACVGVTVWDFYDPYSWVPDTFEGEGDADLWWANFTKKPAYHSIAEVLAE